MADESGKSGSPTISSIAAPTADIDDDWALDDDTGGATRPLAASSKQAHDEDQKSDAPVTEEIDSEWPDDEVSADQLKKPKIPAAPKLPEEAASFASEHGPLPLGSAGKQLETSSVPAAPYRPSQGSIDRFEQAATATSQGAFGIGSSSAPPAANSEPPEAAPAATEAAPTAAEAAPTAPPSVASIPPVAGTPKQASASKQPAAARESVAPESAAAALSQRDSEPAREPAKRKSTVLVLGLAVAAVAVVGIGLASRSMSGPDRAIERAESALEPDPASKAVPTPPAGPATTRVATGAKSEPTPQVDETAAANDNEVPAPSGSALEPGAATADAVPSSDATEATPAAGDTLKVKINIYPDDAEIYHKGKLLGRGGAEVEVLRNERKLLVLIRDGYYPRKLILDGKETKYNIGLRKQPAASFLAGPSSGKNQKATGGAVAPPPAPAPDKAVPLTPPTP